MPAWLPAAGGIEQEEATLAKQEDAPGGSTTSEIQQADSAQQILEESEKTKQALYTCVAALGIPQYGGEFVEGCASEVIYPCFQFAGRSVSLGYAVLIGGFRDSFCIPRVCEYP